VSLQTIEARPVFEGDTLTDLRAEESNRAKGLIEDFMIAANGATVKYLEQQHFPSLRRVLPSPSAGSVSSRLPPRSAKSSRNEPTHRRSRHFSPSNARPIHCAFPIFRSR